MRIKAGDEVVVITGEDSGPTPRKVQRLIDALLVSGQRGAPVKVG